MSPDEKFDELRQQKEKEKLKSIVGKLTDQDCERIFKLGMLCLDALTLPMFQYNTIHNTIQYNTQYNTIQYNTTVLYL